MKTTMKIRMMAAGAACLCAALSASATEWTYTASGTTYTITDGQWTLKVGKLAATNITLKVTGISGWEEPATASDKKGVLDLRKPLTVTVDDATATIASVEVAQSALGWHDNVVEIYCDIIGTMADSCFAGNTNMTNIVIGGTAKSMPGLVLNRCVNLKAVVVRNVSGTADQTGCRVYVSKRQWTKEARDAPGVYHPVVRQTYALA